MAEFNWLHLTDLHWGMEGFKDRWDNVEEEFFKKLQDLIQRSEIGSLDLVLFTGDLVYSGKPEEFEAIDQELLKRLWGKFGEMDFEPKLLAVPGNHDLRRPRDSSALLSLAHLWGNSLVQDPFWDDPESETRKVVKEAFANYENWWQATPLKPEIRSGVLPGDFSTTIEKEGYRLGIVGLNSSFLQLQKDVEAGDLALNNRQFKVACGGSGPRWVRDRDLCLLLTHHPPDWLNEESQDDLDGEIYQPGRFALHLFGHRHDAHLTSLAVGGDDPRRRLQGRSLFAMDGHGEENKKERKHGYSLGQLRIEDGRAHMRIWPHKALERDRVWRMVPNHDDFDLPDDIGTARMTVKESIQPRKERSGGNGAPPAGVPMTLEPERVDPLLTEALDASPGTAYPALRTRLDALEQSLERVKEPPSSWPSGTGLLQEESPEEDLWGPEGNSSVKAQLESLEAIRTNLERAEEPNDPNPGRFIKGAWDGYASVCGSSQQIFREWLDVAGGLTLRAYELDKDLFDMADQLIEDCAVGSGVPSYRSIPAAQEDLAKTMGRVIRLRFPEWTVWNLPFVIHEYGEVVVDHVEVLGKLVGDTATLWVDQDIEWQPTLAGNEEKQAGRRDDYRHQIRKFLADAFATHTIGPAYACAAILLHFDPSLAHDEHDAYGKRARVVLNMLEKMDDIAGGSPYKKMIELLENHWWTVLERAKPSGSSEATDEERLRNLVDEIWEKIDGEYRDEKLYPLVGESGWQVAKAWAVNWMQQSKTGEPLSVWEISPTSKLRDALNAAWLCRISYPGETEQIGEAVYAQCQAISKLASQDKIRPPGGAQSLGPSTPQKPPR